MSSDSVNVPKEFSSSSCNQFQLNFHFYIVSSLDQPDNLHPFKVQLSGTVNKPGEHSEPKEPTLISHNRPRSSLSQFSRLRSRSINNPNESAQKANFMISPDNVEDKSILSDAIESGRYNVATAQITKINKRNWRLMSGIQKGANSFEIVKTFWKKLKSNAYIWSKDNMIEKFLQERFLLEEQSQNMFTYQRPIIFITILYLITQYLSLVLVPLIFSQGIANYVVFIYIPVGLLFVILNHTEWRISIDLILMGTLVAIYITKSIYLCVLFEILCFLLLYKSIVKMFI